MNTPHKHRDVIIAWANGEQIQFKDDRGIWCDSTKPTWHRAYEYRVKPKGPEFYSVGMKFKNSFGAVQMLCATGTGTVNLFEISGGEYPGYRVSDENMPVGWLDAINVEKFHEFFDKKETHTLITED